jgi:hypothetical protein
MSDLPGNGCAGALFGPIFTKWYQLLNKIQFSSATKATAYRVRQSPHPSLVPWGFVHFLGDVLNILILLCALEQVALDQGVATPGSVYLV